MVLLFNTRSITFAVLVELIMGCITKQFSILSMACIWIFINPGNKV